MEAVKQNGYSLQYASENMKRNREIAFHAVKNYCFAIEFVHKDLLDDMQIINQALEQSGYVLKYFNPEQKKNKKIVSKAIKKNGYALMYAHRSSKKIKFIKKILKYYLGGTSLAYCDKCLRSDKKVVLEAVKTYGYAIKDASKTSKCKQVIKASIKQLALH